LLYQFREYVALKDKQVGGYNSKRALTNSAFVNPGIYSCALDAFLEIPTPLVLPYLSNLRIGNEFTDLLLNVCLHYTSSREDSSLLREIREPVWS